MKAPDKRQQARELMRQGYTVVFDTIEGELIPGYVDWTLEWVLDAIELEQELVRSL